MIISHRGNDIYGYKENSKKAILSSLKSDYTDGVEIDVRITKDKKLVLCHDLFYDGKIIKNTLYKNINLDSLDSVLKKIKSKKIIIIEIKDNIDINIVYKIIKKYKKLNIYIHSFYYNFVYNFKRKYPEYKAGLIISKIFNKNKNINSFDFVSINYRIYENIHSNIFAWTVNNKYIFNKFLSNNINIITDKPYLNVDYYN